MCFTRRSERHSLTKRSMLIYADFISLFVSNKQSLWIIKGQLTLLKSFMVLYTSLFIEPTAGRKVFWRALKCSSIVFACSLCPSFLYTLTWMSLAVLYPLCVVFASFDFHPFSHLAFMGSLLCIISLSLLIFGAIFDNLSVSQVFGKCTQQSA